MPHPHPGPPQQVFWSRDPPGCREASLLGGRYPLHTVLGAGSWNWKLRVLEPPFRITGTCGEGPGAAAQAQKVLQEGGRGGCQYTAIP